MNYIDLMNPHEQPQGEPIRCACGADAILYNSGSAYCEICIYEKATEAEMSIDEFIIDEKLETL